MSGAYRRAIITRAEASEAVADIEDDFHRFVVTLRHDGEVVTEVVGQAVRYPWSMCPMAVTALSALKGLPLTTDPTAIYAFTDPRLQCTHQFEMAGLAMNQAARGPGMRRYDAVVTDPEDGVSIATLTRDDEVVLSWRLENGVIAAPSPHAGKKLSDFRSQALGDISPDEAEAILILRRAAGAGRGRQMDIDAYESAADAGMSGGCFVFSRPDLEKALRIKGSIRPFTADHPPLAERSYGDA